MYRWGPQNPATDHRPQRELWHIDWAETQPPQRHSQETAQVICVQIWADPAGPGTALLCLLSGPHCLRVLAMGYSCAQVGTCRSAGITSWKGWDMALLSVTPRCGSAVCFGPGIASTAVLSGVCLGKEGCLSLALPIKNSRIKRSVLIFLLEESVTQTLTSFLVAQFPWELCPLGNFMEDEGEEK